MTSDIGALSETVGRAGILVPGDPGSEEYSSNFVRAVDHLLTNKEAWDKCSEEGKKRAREMYSWSVIAQRFLRYVERALEVSFLPSAS